MDIPSDKDTKSAIKKYKEFNSKRIERRIFDLIKFNRDLILSGDKESFRFNKFLKSYMITIRYKKYVLFGIEKNGFENESLAKADALETLNSLQNDQLPNHSVKNIIDSLNLIDSAILRKTGLVIDR